MEGGRLLFFLLLVWGSQARVMQVGTASVTESWSTVSFDSSITNAVIIAGLSQGGDYTEVNIRNVDNNAGTFEMRVHYDAGTPGPEEIGWIAIASGVHQILGTNTYFVAGKDSSNQYKGEAWRQVNYSHTFSSSPVVFVQVQDHNPVAGEILHTRHQNVGTQSFQYVFEPVGSQGSVTWSRVQTAGWLAVVPGFYSGYVDNGYNFLIDVQLSPSTESYTYTLQGGLVNPTMVGGSPQGQSGGDHFWVQRIPHGDADKVTVMEREDATEGSGGHANNPLAMIAANMTGGACPNDPLVELPRPTLAPASLVGNDYKLVWTFNSSFTSYTVIFEGGASNCNFDSTNPSYTYYTEDYYIPTCTLTTTFQRPAQDTLATCGYSRSNGADYAVYTALIEVTTVQERRIEYQQAFRNRNFTQTKTSHFTSEVKVPFSTTASIGGVNVTGNITVLSAVLSVNVDVSTTPFYQVGFSVLTSSQDPYQLTYKADSFTSTADLGNTATVTSAPACTTGPENSCSQQFDVSAVDITKTCGDGKTTLGPDTVTLTFNVGCKAGFGGNCITPNPAEITATFELQSTEYCPQVDNITLSATLDTYRDVTLNDGAAWDTNLRTSQFVFGSTIYGLIEVSVEFDAASTVTTEMRKVTTVSSLGTVTVYDYNGGSPNKVDGTDVFNAPFDGGNDAKQARFMVPLTSNTVVINGVLDASQAVLLQTEVAVTYTASSANPSDPLILQAMEDARSGKGYRVSADVEQRSLRPSSQFVLTVPTTATPGASGSSSGSGAGMSTTMMAVVGAVAVLVLAVAYRAGLRRGQDEEDTEKLMHTEGEEDIELQATS